MDLQWNAQEGCGRTFWFLVLVVISLLYHQADWHRNSFGEQRPAREQTGPKRALRCGWEIVNWEASRTELSRHCMHGMVGKNGNPSRKSVGKQNPKVFWATVSTCLPFEVFSFFFNLSPELKANKIMVYIFKWSISWTLIHIMHFIHFHHLLPAFHSPSLTLENVFHHWSLNYLHAHSEQTTGCCLAGDFFHALLLSCCKTPKKREKFDLSLMEVPDVSPLSLATLIIFLHLVLLFARSSFFTFIFPIPF